MEITKKKFVYLEKFERTKEAIKLEFKNINFSVNKHEEEIKRLHTLNLDVNKELRKIRKVKLKSDLVLFISLGLAIGSIIFTFNVLNSL